MTRSFRASEPQPCCWLLLVWFPASVANQTDLLSFSRKPWYSRLKVDGTQLLVEKPHPLLSSIHLAAPGSIRYFWSSDCEALHPGGSVLNTEHLQQSRMIGDVVMLSIGLSMDGMMVLGDLKNDVSV